MLSVCSVGDCENGLNTNQERAKEVKRFVCGGILKDRHNKEQTKNDDENDAMMRLHRVVYVRVQGTEKTETKKESRPI